MSDPALAVADIVTFESDQAPPLKDGDYEIRITQTLTTIDPRATVAENKRAFSVAGPRFALDPGLVLSCFPPDASLGLHDNVLPHVSLGRSTLPWERSPVGRALVGAGLPTPNPPWLGLVVLGADEMADAAVESPAENLATLRLATLGKPEGGCVRPQLLSGEVFPDIPWEFGDESADGKPVKLRLLGLPAAVRAIVLPAMIGALTYSAHVRNGADGSIATVIATRLPARGAVSRAFLVSLEGHYCQAGPDSRPDAIGFAPLADGQRAMFVVLASWRFSCENESADFAGLLKGLDAGPFALPSSLAGDPAAEPWLAEGAAALVYEMRDGARRAAWYRGPLRPCAPGRHLDEAQLQRPSPDGMFRIDGATGLVDASLPAAWELGRLMLLSDARVADELYQWKRDHMQAIHAERPGHVRPRPLKPVAQPSAPGWPALKRWVEDVAWLKGVPFAYLVPDMRMLPPSAIRFFKVDPVWLTVLLGGALSVGYLPGSTPPPDFGDLNPDMRGLCSGLLLRSDVVSGWPQLQIDAYGVSAEGVDDEALAKARLTKFRIERLSKTVMLAIFQGDVRTVDIHLPAEHLHFGFDRGDSIDPADFRKALRNLDGKPLDGSSDGTPLFVSAGVDVAKGRRVDLAALATVMNAHRDAIGCKVDHAVFAMQMVEGVERVRFNLGPQEPESKRWR